MDANTFTADLSATAIFAISEISALLREPVGSVGARTVAWSWRDQGDFVILHADMDGALFVLVRHEAMALEGKLQRKVREIAGYCAEAGIDCHVQELWPTGPERRAEAARAAEDMGETKGTA